MPGLVSSSAASSVGASSAGAVAGACRGCAPVIFASPKSSTLASPRRVTNRFAGLMSRWTMPLPWAACNASATCEPMRTISSTGIGEPESRYFKVWPSMSSMTRNGRPSSSPSSWIVQMCGWFSAEAARASRWKRSSASGSSASASGRNLSATRRPSVRSSAS